VAATPTQAGRGCGGQPNRRPTRRGHAPVQTSCRRRSCRWPWPPPSYWAAWWQPRGVSTAHEGGCGHRADVLDAQLCDSGAAVSSSTECSNTRETVRVRHRRLGRCWGGRRLCRGSKTWRVAPRDREHRVVDGSRVRRWLVNNGNDAQVCVCWCRRQARRWRPSWGQRISGSARGRVAHESAPTAPLAPSPEPAPHASHRGISALNHTRTGPDGGTPARSVAARQWCRPAPHRGARRGCSRRAPVMTP
jgi:hypothetical protein